MLFIPFISTHENRNVIPKTDDVFCLLTLSVLVLKIMIVRKITEFVLIFCVHPEVLSGLITQFMT
jgi:hypothetical protein